jgi:hypothetical protein
MRFAARILLAGLCVVWFTGCGTKLGPKDLEALEEGAAALESLGGPDQIVRMLEALMGELELGHSEACRKRYAELANSSPDMRSRLAAEIVDSCGVKCPSDLARLGSMEEAERWKSILAECPGGALDGEGLRQNLSAVEYAVLRQLYVVDLKAALDKDGSERAKALWPRYDKLLGRLGAAAQH